MTPISSPIAPVAAGPLNKLEPFDTSKIHSLLVEQLDTDGDSRISDAEFGAYRAENRRIVNLFRTNPAEWPQSRSKPADRDG